MKRVYAFEMESHIVKIGISQDVAQRMQQVAYDRKERIVNFHFTEFAPRAVAAQIERACHETFADRRLFGEFFDISFTEACAELDSYADEIEMANIDANLAEIERADDSEVEREYSPTGKITEALKRFRKEYRLSQRQVAEDLGMSQQSYYYYESKGDPPSAAIVKLAQTYNVSTDYLLGLSDNPVSNNSEISAETTPLSEVKDLSERLSRLEAAFAEFQKER